MKNSDIYFCVSVVQLLAKRSRATRAQVGCVIWDMKQRTIVSLGYNGTPEGTDNTMEHDGKTLPTVIHAEMNALRKLPWYMRRKHLVLFVTHTPCEPCARSIASSGVKQVYYLHNYGTHLGVQHLLTSGVDVKRLVT